MLTSLLAEALAASYDNLTLTTTIFKCVEEAAEDLSPEAKQRLGLIHTGLALAIQGLECDEIQQLIRQSEVYCDF